MQKSITLIHYYRLHALSNCLCYQKIAASMESKNTREPVKKKFPTDPCRKSNGRPASLLRVHNCEQRSYCREDKLFQREEEVIATDMCARWTLLPASLRNTEFTHVETLVLMPCFKTLAFLHCGKQREQKYETAC